MFVHAMEVYNNLETPKILKNSMEWIWKISVSVWHCIPCLLSFAQVHCLVSSHVRINFWYLEILPETLSILGKQIKHIKLTQCTLNKQQEVRDCWYVQLLSIVHLYMMVYCIQLEVISRLMHVVILKGQQLPVDLVEPLSLFQLVVVPRLSG